MFGRKRHREIIDRLDFDEYLLKALIAKNGEQMSLGQDLLDKVTEMDTKVDSVIAFIDGLKNDGTISPEVAAAIKAKIQGSEDKLDAAIGANTTPTV